MGEERTGRMIWLGRDSALLLAWLQAGGMPPAAFCGSEPVKGLDLHFIPLAALPEQEQAYEGVILAPDFDPAWLAEMEKTSLSIWYLPAHFEEVMRWSRPWCRPENLLVPLLVSPVSSLAFRYGKRGMDIFLATIVFLLSLPLWPLIAVAIKLSSSGPVFHVQKRAGLRGRPFKLYKFRTLAVEADKELIWGQAEQKSPTRIGRFLRRSGLDELPQIINILKGDMSLVGPRPERVEFVTLFSEKIPHYMQRHMVPPGVTGWAQINGWRGDTPLAPRIEHDLWYIAHWSLALDVGILLKTIPFILKTLLSK